jgi:hypothetical protein
MELKSSGRRFMEEILTVPPEMEAEAKRITEVRKQIKDYLTTSGVCYDKFTVTENDTYLGYVSETAIAGYLRERYGDRLAVNRWADRFDMDRIHNAIKNNDKDADEIAYVKDYFYDEYDLEIVERSTGKVIRIDVKTAETSKKPQDTWNFLYPVVQNQRHGRYGKDCVVLCYYYKMPNTSKIILVGYLSEDDIAGKKILKAGSKTKFGTVNQIDNYETQIRDYRPLADMLDKYYGSAGRAYKESAFCKGTDIWIK